MNGKIVRLASNDIYGNNDSRNVYIFMCFKELKYMNSYVIFCYEDELDKKIIYYGSLHLKNNSLVCFSVKDEKVKDYVNDMINNKIDTSKYEILDISKMEKIEIISLNSMECNNLKEIKDRTIKIINKEEVKEDDKKKDPFLLYLLLIILIGGIDVLYFYFNSGLITKKYKYMDCSIEKYDSNIKINYIENRLIRFNDDNSLKKLEVTLSYEFKDIDEYYEFKDSDKQYDYFKKGTYKYDDTNKILKIFYEDESIIDNYTEMKNYLIKEGYDCTYGEYRE